MSTDSTDVKYTIDSESIKKIIGIKRNLFKKYKDLLEMDNSSKYQLEGYNGYEYKQNVIYNVRNLIFYYDDICYCHKENIIRDTVIDSNIFKFNIKIEQPFINTLIHASTKTKIHFYITLTHPDDLNKTMVVDLVYKELDKISIRDEIFNLYRLNIKEPSTCDDFEDNLLSIDLIDPSCLCGSSLLSFIDFGKEYIDINYLANNDISLARRYIDRKNYKQKEAKIKIDNEKLTQEEINNIYKYRNEVYNFISTLDILKNYDETKKDIYNRYGKILPALKYLLKYRDYGSINMKMTYYGNRSGTNTVNIDIRVPKANIKDLNNEDDFIRVDIYYNLLDKVSNDNEYVKLSYVYLGRAFIGIDYDKQYNKEQVDKFNKLGNKLITEDYLEEYIIVNDSNEILDRCRVFIQQNNYDNEIIDINKKAEEELSKEQIDNIRICKETLYETLSTKINFIHFHNGPKLHTSLLYLLQKREYKTLEITTESDVDYINLDDDTGEPKFLVYITLYKPDSTINNFGCDISNSRKLVLKYKNRKEPYIKGYLKLENISFTDTDMPPINRIDINKTYKKLYDEIGNELVAKEYINEYFISTDNRENRFPNIDILFEDKNK